MKNKTLIIGDILAIAIVTFIGFATHGEADVSFLPRMGAAFFPLVIAWFLLAPWFGLFEENVIRKPRQLWRPAWCVFFVAPFAGIMRGLLLQSDVSPVFIIILGLTSAVGLTVWRCIWVWLSKPK